MSDKELLRKFIRYGTNYIRQVMHHEYKYGKWDNAYHDLGQFHGRLDSILSKPLAENKEFMLNQIEVYHKAQESYLKYEEEHPKEWPKRREYK